MKQLSTSRNLHNRLHKIAGQVQAIDKMVDQGAPCKDILTQINAARAALLCCGKIVFEGHIHEAVQEVAENGKDEEKAKEDISTNLDRFSGMIN